MDDLMIAILMVLSVIAFFSVYVFCIRTVFPKYIIKKRYRIEDDLGRGLKKYTSELGRAVVYEPHPRIRKYIKKYALVEREGHKYLECSIDRAVKRLSYTVVMLNNKNKVIDVLEVNDLTAKMTVTNPVCLHPDTSYIALSLQSVNGERLEGGSVYYYKLSDVSLFALATAAASFIAYAVCSLATDVFVARVGGDALNISFSFSSALATSLLIGVASAVLLLLYCNRKNVRVILNDR